MDKTYKDFPITKNLNGSYTITAIIGGQEFPYNVYKDDAYCKYDFEEVEEYWNGLNDSDEKKLEEKKTVIPKPTAEEKKAAALDELDKKYRQDKEVLAEQYLDAAMSDDKDTMATIKQELTALNEKYDADYKSIKGDA